MNSNATMANDLLAKEKEFHKMNQELEEKTRNLMIEVESVMNNEIKINPPPSQIVSIKPTPKDTNNSIEPTIHSDEDTSKNKTMLVNYLKTKIQIFHNELRTMQIEYKKKLDYCHELEIENKKLNDTKLKLQNQTDTLRETLTKRDKSNENIQSQFKSSNVEIIQLKKDLDVLEKDMKTLKQQSNAAELRLNRSLEDNEKLRNRLKLSQIEERDLRNQMKNIQDDKTRKIKILEKQLNELIQAFKKQTSLIDNLKKQNVCLITNQQIKLTTDDFSKLLDWDPRY